MAVASAEVLLLGLVGCRSSSQVRLFPEKLSTSPSPAAISLKLCSRQTAALRRRLAPVQAHRRCPSESGGGPVFYPHRFAQVLSFLQTLPDVRARCRQIERYGKMLSPVPTPLVTTANRVEGIPASYNTFAHAYLDPGDPSLVYFYAHSDAAHVRGLAAILAQGLSGSPVRTIAAMPLSSFALLIGQSLLPARWCTHFMLLLEHMRRKACHLIKTNTRTTSVQNYYNSNVKHVLSVMGLGDLHRGLKDENHEIHQIHVVHELLSTIGLGTEVHDDDDDRDDDVHVDLKRKKIYI